MKRLAALLLVLVGGCGQKPEPPPIPEDPVAWSVKAEVDKKEVQVGEDLTLTLDLHHPVDGRYVSPPEASFAPFDVISKSEEVVSPIETRLRLRLGAYRLPGDVEIPGLSISYQHEGKVETLETKPIPVRIVTSLTPGVTDIHDIKGPMDLEVPRDLRLLWWLLLALAAALLAYLIYRKLRKEPESVRSAPFAPPLPPPDVEAEEALRRLAERQLIAKGEWKAFYTELSEIVKRYAGRRFEVPYLERTTSEVLLDLKPRKLDPAALSELRLLLEAADLVKFAKLVPEAEKAEEALGLARGWIARTRPLPAPSSEPEKRIA